MTLQRAAFIAAIILLASGCSSSNDGSGTTDQDSAITDTSVTDTGNDSGGDETNPDVAVDANDTAPKTDATDASEASEVADDATDATDVSTETHDASHDGDADSGDGACKPGSIESEACGKCGMRSRLCAEDGGGWLPWGDCAAETGECTPKDARTIPCGRCGTRAQTCDDTCTWISAVCTGEGACDAGDTEIQYDVCTDPTQVKVRTCSATCTWSDWSACEPHP